MIGTRLFYVFIGVALAVSLTPVLALTVSEKTTIETEQNYAFDLTGTYKPYFSDLYEIHTYEKLCTGYVVIEKTDAQIKYTAFGDLSEQLTYTVDTIGVDTLIASSTFPIDEKSNIIDIVVDTVI